jgi:hypothetical protein
MLGAIEATRIATAVRESVWAYPLLEIVHIAAFAVMLGAVFLVELRVFGAARELPLVPLGRLGQQVGLAAFAVAAASGALMFASSAREIAVNAAFLPKLGLIAIAGANMLVFHARGSLQRADALARGQAALSLLLWLAVICAGRLIAYL